MSSTKKGTAGSASGSRSSRSKTTERICEERFARWLANGFTGCGFAQSFAQNSRLQISAFDGVAEPVEIDTLFETAAGEGMAAVVLFPTFRSEDQLVDQLLRLRSGDRWTVSRETVQNLETKDLLVGLKWTTAAGVASFPMGFGPFATMPVTRRAPYVALAAWTSGHENIHPHRRKPMATAVDFLDARLPEELTKVQYDKLWDNSVDRTGRLLDETGDKAKFYRTVAFRLSPAVADQL